MAHVRMFDTCPSDSPAASISPASKARDERRSRRSPPIRDTGLRSGPKRSRRPCRCARIAAALLALAFFACDARSPERPVQGNPRLVPVGTGWAGTAINATTFRQHALASHNDTQYLAFYDPDGRVVLARRTLGGNDWQTHRTELTGDVRDAHNAISIAIDGDGVLHMAWDHHGRPLNYVRATAPGALSLGERRAMTGEHETHVTYPEFYNLDDGDLLFMYRFGAGPEGWTMLNRYVRARGEWTIVQHALLDGEHVRVPYTNQLAIDAQGRWHVSWVWRENRGVESNHDLCYARSDDQGRTWLRSDGGAYSLPITQATSDIICPIHENSDLMNQCSTAVDSRGRPMVASYWRPAGSEVPQYHLVWFDGAAWQVQQVSRRTTPFRLGGAGSKSVPIARPKLAVDRRDRVFMFFRDDERGGRISVAICDDPQRHDWRFIDLTDESFKRWEPLFDAPLWRRRGMLHLFAQPVGQGDAETTAAVGPQPVAVLEWTPPP